MTTRRILIFVGLVGLVALVFAVKDRIETLEAEKADLQQRLSDAERRIVEIDKRKYATVGERIEVIETPLGTLTRRIETLEEIPLDYEYAQDPNEPGQPPEETAGQPAEQTR